jgi:secreted trypsin-like serine protease
MLFSKIINTVGDKDTCLGDSGGGLYAYDSKLQRYVVVGITSYGVGCASAGYPGIYTRISYFYNWIMANVKYNNNYLTTLKILTTTEKTTSLTRTTSKAIPLTRTTSKTAPLTRKTSKTTPLTRTISKTTTKTILRTTKSSGNSFQNSFGSILIIFLIVVCYLNYLLH